MAGFASQAAWYRMENGPKPKKWEIGSKKKENGPRPMAHGPKMAKKWDLGSLVTRIAATSNRKSLATAIATQNNHCDSENTSGTAAISLRFLREKLATSKL